MPRSPISVDRVGTLPVLLIDRSPDLRSVLRGILRSGGIRTILGVDRVEHIDELGEAPNVILVFVRLSDDGSGWTIAADLRAGRLAVPRDVRLIAYAAAPTVHTLRRALMAGIDEFLALPVTARATHAKLSATLERPKRFIVSGPYTGPDNLTLIQKLGLPEYGSPS